MGAAAAVSPANSGRELLYQVLLGSQRRPLCTALANIKFDVLRVQASNKYAEEDASLPEPRYKFIYYNTATSDFVKYCEPVEDSASLSLQLVNAQSWPYYFQLYLEGRFKEFARLVCPKHPTCQTHICAYLNSKIDPAEDQTRRVFKLFQKILMGRMKSKAKKEAALFDKREHLVNKFLAPGTTPEERDLLQEQIDRIELLIDQL